MALAWKCLTARLRDNTWTGSADISEVKYTRVVRIQISQIRDCAVVELYSLKW